MRAVLLALLTLIGAFAPAGLHADENKRAVVDKVVLMRWSSDLLVRELLREGIEPPGVDGILSYSEENSLLIRGAAEGVTNLMRALRVVDVRGVEKEQGDTTVTLRPDRAKADDLRAAMLALPLPGSVTLQDGALALKGPVSWVRKALMLTVRRELAAR